MFFPNLRDTVSCLDSESDKLESGSDSPVIAYVFMTFPKLSETFTLREVIELQRLGLKLDFFSIRNPGHNKVTHPEAKTFAERTHYSPWFVSLKLWKSNLYYILRCPLKYFRLLIGLIFSAASQPAELLKTIAVFPKSVYFAYLAQKSQIKHIHAPFASHNGTCAMIMADLAQIKYSVTTHAYDIVFERALLRQRLSKARFIATISNFNVQLIKERYGDEIQAKTHLIRCGVDLKSYLPRENNPESTGEFKPFTILCVAEFRPVKGHRYLLEAIARLKSQGRNIQCVLVGDGNLRRDIINQIKRLNIENTVKMIGYQTQQEVISWLRTSDCVVLSSLSEGIPVALMEAMACGLPVVATDTSRGITELVVSGRNGVLVPPKDVKSLAEALAYVQDNPSLAQEFGKEGRKIIEQKYDLEKNVKKLWRLFLFCLNYESMNMEPSQGNNFKNS